MIRSVFARRTKTSLIYALNQHYSAIAPPYGQSHLAIRPDNPMPPAVLPFRAQMTNTQLSNTTETREALQMIRALPFTLLILSSLSTSAYAAAVSINHFNADHKGSHAAPSVVPDVSKVPGIDKTRAIPYPNVNQNSLTSKTKRKSSASDNDSSRKSGYVPQHSQYTAPSQTPSGYPRQRGLYRNRTGMRRGSYDNYRRGSQYYRNRYNRSR